MASLAFLFASSAFAGGGWCYAGHGRLFAGLELLFAGFVRLFAGLEWLFALLGWCLLGFATVFVVGCWRLFLVFIIFLAKKPSIPYLYIILFS